MMDEDLFYRLVEAAIAAPSAENRHHVRFRHRGDSIEIVPDDFFLADASARQVLHRLAVGAMVENIVITLAADGFGAEVQWHDPGAASIATVTLDGPPSDSAALQPFIARRCTNRNLHFGGSSLSPKQRLLLSQDAECATCKVLWMDSKALRRALLSVATLAERQRYLSETLHRELFQDIRFDLGWHVTSEEGLAPATLGIEPPLRPAFKLLRNWRLMRVLNIFGAAHMLGLRAARLPLWLAPDLCVIACNTASGHGVLDAGRTMQRLWLKATQAGLSVQPFAASALYALPDYPGVDPSLRRRMVAAWREIAADRLPVMVLRLGYARAPSMRAQRPDPGSFVAA